jgi:methyltransferase-like protein 6
MVGDELSAAVRLMLATSCDKVRHEQKKWRAPRTHMHSEMVQRRRDPVKSPKTNVEQALLTLAAGDPAAVEALMAREGDLPVPQEWQERYKADARAYWDQFYRERTVNFFKDRHYLREEFCELMPAEVLEDPHRWVDEMECNEEPPHSPRSLERAMQGRTVLLELGCAVGNGVLPLLRANHELFAFACDLSPVAVSLLKEKPEYRCGRCMAFPCDISHDEKGQPTSDHVALESIVPAGAIDYATLLFVLSAIDPALHCAMLTRIRLRLKEGGVVLVRDYGRGDLAQLRFASGHWLGGDLYVRGDGTLALFFTVDGLKACFEAAGFRTLECEYRRTEIVNRGTGVRMPRVWVQGRFQSV